MAIDSDAPLAFDAALTLLAEQSASLPVPQRTERVRLDHSWNRVLATPVRADRDQPAFDRATRDGFAIRSATFSTQGARVVGLLRAGQVYSGPALKDGEAVEIMTGAPVPPGADAVCMVEHVKAGGGRVSGGTGRVWTAGENIVGRGSEAEAGEVVLAAGTLLGAAEMALAAACGAAELELWARPRVAVVATGDELVPVEATPSAWQIRNSNSTAIAAMAEAAGAEVKILPVARDTREQVRERIAEGRAADLLIFSGGVSMGKYDLVEEVLAELRAEFFFTGVAMQPGKPVVFGRLPEKAETTGQPALPGCLFFGLPGNPVSTQVTFHCFAEPLLRALAGAGVRTPRWALARLGAPAEGRPGLTRLLPAVLTGTEVRVEGWQGSGDLAANARANCYVELRAGCGELGAGEVVRILLRD